MSKSDEMLVDSLVRFVIAECSLRWSLIHWLMKKALGEPTARVIAQLALPRASYFRKQVWSELKVLPGEDLIRLLQVLLPHKSRRRFLRERKKTLAPEMQGLVNLSLLQEFKNEFEKGIPRGHSVLVAGGPGSGKTTFAIQFLYKGATEHNEPGIYISLDEDPEDVKKNMSKFEWDLGKLEDEKRLAFINVSPSLSLLLLSFILSWSLTSP